MRMAGYRPTPTNILPHRPAQAQRVKDEVYSYLTLHAEEDPNTLVNYLVSYFPNILKSVIEHSIVEMRVDNVIHHNLDQNLTLGPAY